MCSHLPDDPKTRWPADRIAMYVEDVVQDKGINHIITFSDYGVSGHPNHSDIHRGLL